MSPTMPPTLSTLFAGEEHVAALVDGSAVEVRVRALPQRHLVRVLAVAETPSDLIELCACTRTADGLPAAAHPDIAAPAGWSHVPAGWADNLADESFAALHEAAQRLNFTRAATEGRLRIAAKKLVAPLEAEAIAQVRPLVDSILLPLLRRLETLCASMPSAPSSAASPASNSSTSPSSGSSSCALRTSDSSAPRNCATSP